MTIEQIDILVHVFKTDSGLVEDDPRPRFWDSESDYSQPSDVSAQSVGPFMQLRFLDHPNSIAMFAGNAEKCYLKSKCDCDPTETNDPNNIVFMSRLLHELFDGINRIDKVPRFTLDYVRHDSNVVLREIKQGDEMLTLNLYETLVQVTFMNENTASILSPCFRDHQKTSPISIQFSLYFENPDKFNQFASEKSSRIRAQWASLAGPDGQLEDEAEEFEVGEGEQEG